MKRWLCLFMLLISVNLCADVALHQRSGYIAEIKPSAAATPTALAAAYTVTTVWATAYQVSVTLTNNTTAATTSWTSTFTLPAAYVLSTHVTGGTFTTSGQNVTVQNLASNGAIAANGTVTYTMIIDMPLSGQTVINNLQAIGNGGGAPTLAAPILSAISNPSNANTYTVGWNTVPTATKYTLQESTNSSFTNPTTIFSGSLTSFNVTGKTAGTYYYRVTASSATATSVPSNVQSTTVGTVPSAGIEHAAWYIDWTAWFFGPTYNIPTGVGTLNVFVGELTFDASGNPTLGGFGNLNPPELDAFVAYCKAQSPPIAVKVSIGGGGGSYDNCWDALTSSNIQAFAQGMVNYCHAHGLSGVDFDYEEFASAAQETLVGQLILAFKTLDPTLHTSLCTNAGFSTWMPVIQTIFNAAMIAPNNCAVDRLYVMSYYDPIASEEGWITQWANWAIQNYGFTPARISVGIDDFDAHAYDPVAFYNWAGSQGYSTVHWAYNPATP